MVAIGVRGTQRLSRIVDDIVDLERFQSGGFGITPGRQVMGDLVDELADVLEPVARARGIDLVVDAGAAVAWCDGDRVMQALVNLTGNALKFAPSGSQVVVGAETLDDWVVVSVSDRGRGIPADQLALVFERFHQVDPVGDQAKGGAGLGLTITLHIVDAHGGRIWVESEPGEGATFRFTLPAGPPPRRSAQDQDESDDSRQQPQGQPRAGQRPLMDREAGGDGDDAEQGGHDVDADDRVGPVGIDEGRGDGQAGRQVQDRGHDQH